MLNCTKLRFKVLEVMSECAELIASSVSPKYFVALSDRTLHRWATQERLPRKIQLRNIFSNFTLDGIITMINVSSKMFLKVESLALFYA